jgi:NAD+ diphosphatase
MIGFTAKYARGEITCDPTEIAEADWYAPDAFPAIPTRVSISRQLIDDFVARMGYPRLPD